MLRILFYDIASDRPRTRLTKRLEREGFSRLQYSVYAGDLRPDHWERVWKAIKELHAKQCAAGDRIYVTKLDADHFRNLEALGTAPDIPFILNEQVCLYL